MNGFSELAKEIYKRTNNKTIGVCVGEVINLTPVTIGVYYNGNLIEYSEFFNVKGLINGGQDITKGDLYVEKYPVEIGDKFICIACVDNQSIYVIDKFESIKDLNIYLIEK